jgi:putative spermidine/putrescine transport system permease protein
LSAFWTTDSFTSELVHEFTLDNFRTIFETPVYRDVALRTVTMAAAVTLACAVLAFPLAYYMARLASVRTRNLLVVAVLMPLWASYLVKAYAWQVILSGQGVINWFLDPFGVQFDGRSNVGLWLVFTYLWLPYMVLPIYAGLERIPGSLLEASADLGGKSLRTFSKVTLPLVFPAVVAGSIFTFSLTLGDYIAPTLIASDQFIGTVIYREYGTALPIAAAYAMVPIAVIIGYLLVARKLKAFESL